MKLIIDIPDDTANNIKNYGTFLNPKDKEILKRVFHNSQLLDGVLDNLRAEIEQTVEREMKEDEKWALGLRYSLQIIDKYREGEDE